MQRSSLGAHTSTAPGQIRGASTLAGQANQKNNFRPNWTNLGLVPGYVLLTTPKVDDVTLVFGGANCVRLKMLKNSARNSNPSLSSGPKRVLLNSAKSKLFIPDPRILGSTRASLPNVKSAGAVKHPVLNH